MFEVKTADLSHSDHGGELDGSSFGVEIIVHLLALANVEAYGLSIVLTDFKITVR